MCLYTRRVSKQEVVLLMKSDLAKTLSQTHVLVIAFCNKMFQVFQKKVGYILWGIAVGAKREQRELLPERMGQPRGHGQVRPQVRPRLRPWQQPNRFSFFELPKKIMALTAMSLCCL